MSLITPGPVAARPRGRRGELMSADCPSRAVMQHVTSRWGLLVLLVLLQGTHRFSALRRQIGGVSEKMLAQSLQALEGDGFVARRAYEELPLRVEYSLTPLGREVAWHAQALADWIEGNLPRILKQARAAAHPPGDEAAPK